MFKSHPFFGVGFGRYTDFNRLVAHNSFVHTLGELGFLGAFAFVGMGYWFFHSSRRQLDDAGGWGQDLWQSGLALTVCAMFLSRQYNVTLFVWLALSAAYVQLMAGPSRLSPTRQAVHLARIAAITAGGVICTHVAVRLLGNWSV